MNTLMLVALAVVLLCYCGGKYCPKVLSSNKEMLLGVLVGLALCSFAGLKLEGFSVTRECCRGGNLNSTGSAIVWDTPELEVSCLVGDPTKPEEHANRVTTSASDPGNPGWVERCATLLSSPPSDATAPISAAPPRTAKTMREENRGLSYGGTDLNEKVNKP